MFSRHRAVKVARCPYCDMFFLVHDYAKTTVCRFCKTYFKLHIRPKARHFRPPRRRVVATFRDHEKARECVAQLNDLSLKGSLVFTDIKSVITKMGGEFHG